MGDPSMNKFVVTFQLKSFYDDEQHDKTAITTKNFEADNLDDLFEVLDDMDEIDQIDDQEVINNDTGEEPEEINVEYVLIHDPEGAEVYRDEDYKA